MDGEEYNNKDRLVNDLRTLMTDAEELLRVTASQAGEKIGAARQRIEQSLTEGRKALADAEKTLVTKSKECAEIADDYVRENPWSAVGMACAWPSPPCAGSSSPPPPSAPAFFIPPAPSSSPTAAGFA